MTAVNSTQLTNPPTFSLPPPQPSSQINPMSPSHLYEEEHVLGCWGKSFHFPERFATRKIFLLLKDLCVTTSSVSYRMSWCTASHLKGFQGRGARAFFTFFSLTWVKVIIHSRRAVRDDPHMTFSLSCFVVADPRQKDCRSPTSAVVSLSLSSVQHI